MTKQIERGFSKRFNEALRIKNYHNKSLRELADLFDVSRTSVHNWLHLDYCPSNKKAETIAKILGVSFVWLIRGRGEPLDSDSYSFDEIALIDLYRNLNDIGKRKILRIAFTDLSQFEIIPRTKVENQATLQLVSKHRKK